MSSGAVIKSPCLDPQQAFVSQHGAAFYKLPRNEATFELAATEWTVPEDYLFGGDDVVVPVNAGETLPWRAKMPMKSSE